jgi:hypothetical protein
MYILAINQNSSALRFATIRALAIVCRMHFIKLKYLMMMKMNKLESKMELFLKVTYIFPALLDNDA